MPYDRPTKNELVTSVREFLEDKLLPELKGHISFNTRVAINVLKTVERELDLGEATTNHILNQQLSQSINQRDLTYHDKDLIDHLWKTTMDKLSIDNPRYASYQEELKNNS